MLAFLLLLYTAKVYLAAFDICNSHFFPLAFAEGQLTFWCWLCLGLTHTAVQVAGRTQPTLGAVMGMLAMR